MINFTLKATHKKYDNEYYLLIIDPTSDDYLIEDPDGKFTKVSNHDLYDMIHSYFYTGDKEDL
jgi:hypothetical protein